MCSNTKKSERHKEDIQKHNICFQKMEKKSRAEEIVEEIMAGDFSKIDERHQAIDLRSITPQII